MCPSGQTHSLTFFISSTGSRRNIFPDKSSSLSMRCSRRSFFSGGRGPSASISAPATSGEGAVLRYIFSSSSMAFTFSSLLLNCAFMDLISSIRSWRPTSLSLTLACTVPEKTSKQIMQQKIYRTTTLPSPRKRDDVNVQDRSPGYRFILLPVPSHPPQTDSGMHTGFVPVTVAGQRQIYNCLPLHLAQIQFLISLCPRLFLPTKNPHPLHANEKKIRASLMQHFMPP